MPDGKNTMERCEGKTLASNIAIVLVSVTTLLVKVTALFTRVVFKWAPRSLV